MHREDELGCEMHTVMVTLTPSRKMWDTIGLRLKGKKVCEVLEVRPRGAASRAGVMPGMVVSAVDCVSVTSVKQVYNAVNKQRPHGRVELTVGFDYRRAVSGRVAEWQPEHGCGVIEPDAPIVTGGRVYVGGIVCRSAELQGADSCDAGTPVAFRIRRCTSSPCGFEAADVARLQGGHLPPCPPPTCLLPPVLDPAELVRLLGGGSLLPFPSEPQSTAPHTVTFKGFVCSRHQRGDLSVTFSPSEPEAVSCSIDGSLAFNVSRLYWDGADTLSMPESVQISVPAGVLERLALLADAQNVMHNLPGPGTDTLLAPVSDLDELRSLQQQSSVCLFRAWKVHNPDLVFRFRATEHNMTLTHGRPPQVVTAFHGTPSANVLSIARRGFDTRYRCKQVHGAGEYFAQRALFAKSYGRTFVFLCTLLLGKEDVDHNLVSGIYVIKNLPGTVQVLPTYLLQVEPDCEPPMQLRLHSARGPCPLKRRCGEMHAEATSKVWVGWFSCSEAELEKAVRDTLASCQVQKVTVDRRSTGLGAMVHLASPVTRLQVAELNSRVGWNVSVLDVQFGDQEPAEIVEREEKRRVVDILQRSFPAARVLLVKPAPVDAEVAARFEWRRAFGNTAQKEEVVAWHQPTNPAIVHRSAARVHQGAYVHNRKYSLVMCKAMPTHEESSQFSDTLPLYLVEYTVVSDKCKKQAKQKRKQNRKGRGTSDDSECCRRKALFRLCVFFLLVMCLVITSSIFRVQ